jgi:hypothetical protein
MRRDASVCPHCRRESKAWTFYDGFWWAKRADGSLVYLDERRNAWRQFESDAEAPLAPRN